MKILHFGKFYPPFNGGMEIYLRDLAEQQSLNHEVTALVHNHDFKTIKSTTLTETINRVDIIRQKTLKPILFTPIMLGTNKAITTLIDANKVDIIHVSWPNPSALLMLFNKKAKTKPWVIQWQSDMVTQHSSWLLKLAYKVFRPLEKMILKQSKLIIASSEEYFKHSIALKDFKKKCKFVPLAIKKSTQNIDTQDKQWANAMWNDAKYKVYNIGRLTFYKNQQLLIQAAEMLPDAKFITTGSGELETELKQKIQSKGLDNIILTGGLDFNKLRALLDSCNVFCLPSNDRAESYGMVLLEALEMNKNILVSDLPGSGMKWIASQTQLGMTFENDNCSDLIEKIKLQSSSKENSFDNSIFQIEHCSNEIDELYHAIV